MKMKRLEIIRVDPNTGYVVRLDDNLQKIKITEILPYKSCMAYVMENQEEATVYKIGKIANRKNAKRRYDSRILAQDDNDAVRKFTLMPKDDTSIYQLLTGDWKIIAERQSNGIIRIL